MIVSKAELELVNRGKRKQMWLPTLRGDKGQLLPCPVEPEQAISLQPSHGVKGTRVTVLTVTPGRLSGMTDADVRQLGVYGGVKAAIAAFARQHGLVAAEAEVWIVQFALGDLTAFFSRHRERYLRAKGVGTTTDPKLAARGEPAVTTEEELQLARKARDRRRLEEHQALRREKRVIEEAIRRLREQGFSKAIEGELRLAERRVEKAERLLAEEAA